MNTVTIWTAAQGTEITSLAWSQIGYSPPTLDGITVYISRPAQHGHDTCKRTRKEGRQDNLQQPPQEQTHNRIPPRSMEANQWNQKSWQQNMRKPRSALKTSRGSASSGFSPVPRKT